MSVISPLGEFEQLVLLAVLRLDDQAYGASVWNEIAERSGRNVTLGTVYKTLIRLEEKRLVRSRMGDPTAQRGGRRKREYTLTTSGRAALLRSLHALQRMTDGLGLVEHSP